MAYILDSLNERHDVWNTIGKRQEDILYNNGSVGVGVSSDDLLNIDKSINLYVNNDMKIDGTLVVDTIQTNAVYNKDTSSIIVNTGDSSGDTSGTGGQWVPLDNTSIYSMRDVGIGLSNPMYPLDVSGIIACDTIKTDELDMSLLHMYKTPKNDVSVSFDNNLFLGESFKMYQNETHLNKPIVINDVPMFFVDSSTNKVTKITSSYFDAFTSIYSWNYDPCLNTISSFQNVGIKTNDLSDISESLRVEGGFNLSGTFVFNDEVIYPNENFRGATELGQLRDVNKTQIQDNFTLIGDSSQNTFVTQRLDSDLIKEGTNNLFYTDSRVSNVIQNSQLKEFGDIYTGDINLSTTDQKVLVWNNNNTYVEQWVPQDIVTAINLGGTKYKNEVQLETSKIPESNDNLYLNAQNLSKFGLKNLADVQLFDVGTRSEGYLYFSYSNNAFKITSNDPTSGEDVSGITINGTTSTVHSIGLSNLEDVSDNAYDPSDGSILQYISSIDKWKAFQPSNLTLDSITISTNLVIENGFRFESGPQVFNSALYEDNIAIKTQDWFINEKQYDTIENEPLVKRVSNIRYSKFNSDEYGVFRLFDVPSSNGRAQGYFNAKYWIYNTELTTKNTTNDSSLNDTKYLSEGNVAFYFDTSDTNGDFILNGYGEMYENIFDSSLSFSDRFATIGVQRTGSNHINDFAFIISEITKQDNFFLNFDTELYVLEGNEPIFNTPPYAKTSITTEPDPSDLSDPITNSLGGDTSHNYIRVDQELPSTLDSQSTAKRYMQYISDTSTTPIEITYKHTPLKTVGTWEYDPSFIRFTMYEPDFIIHDTTSELMSITNSTTPPLTTFYTDVSISNTITANDISLANDITASNMSIINTITANDISLANDITASNIDVSNTITADDISLANDITASNINVSNNMSSASMSVSNGITADTISLLNGLTASGVSVVNDVSASNIYVSDTIETVDISASQEIHGNNLFISDTIEAVDVSASQEIHGNNLFISDTIEAVDVSASKEIHGNNLFISDTIEAVDVSASQEIHGNNLFISDTIEAVDVSASKEIYGNTAFISDTIEATDISASKEIYANDIIAYDAVYLNDKNTWRIKTSNNDLVFEYYNGSSFIEKHRLKNN